MSLYTILLMIALTMKKGFIPSNLVAFKPHESTLISIVKLHSGKRTSAQLFSAFSAPLPDPASSSLGSPEAGAWELAYTALALFSHCSSPSIQLLLDSNARRPAKSLSGPRQRVYSSYATHKYFPGSVSRSHTHNK